MKSMLEQVHQDPKKYLFVYTESKFLNRKALRPVLEKETIIIEYFRKIIEEGVKSGQFNSRRPLLDASIICLLFMLEPLRGWSYRSQFSYEEMRPYLIDFCLRALSGDGGKMQTRRKASKEPRSQGGALKPLKQF